MLDRATGGRRRAAGEGMDHRPDLSLALHPPPPPEGSSAAAAEEVGEEEAEGGEGRFSLMGQPLFLKRPRPRPPRPPRARGVGDDVDVDVDDDSSPCCSSSCLSPAAKRRAAAGGLEARRAAVRAWGCQPLTEADPDVHELMERERRRQAGGVELIASENYACRAVLDALGSHLTNKYSEGLPGARYYCGNQHIDAIERLCCDRALAAFGLDPSRWGVNVQPYSCTSANFAVYTGLLLPNDRIMGLDSPSGGHVSHGYYTPSGKKVSGASIFFENLSYRVNPHTGYIDYDKVEEKAVDFHPKILICGASSYPRDWDYARMRLVADKCGAVLMCDMAQISGLVAAKECRNPFDYCDIVTSTTHKSLRGPRGGIIFFRKGKNLRKRVGSLTQVVENDQYDFEDRINFAVFPSMQGGPHNNHIAALAIALKQVAMPEFKAYIQQVKKNAQALAMALLRRKCRLVTGGTDNHLMLWDLRTFGLTGKNFEKVCEACHISLNKTPIYGDNGSISPGGVRIGTPAMTTRGCLESDFEIMAEFLLRAAHIASIVLKEHGRLQKDFLKGLENNNDIIELRNQICLIFSISRRYIIFVSEVIMTPEPKA
ncbi:serine hydroxymethyltransferase 7 isoform X3 [Oryza sativa Japonica Group]|uniref:serine hydroxymethyltransferase 7 isoform X3 n=1 Tax=Oryza sativa subsp. japonica TaxID=39947 RepID=UPI00339CE8AF